MAIGPVIKSALKETIKNLPEEYSRKSGKTATAELLKKGVKKEELDFSGIEIPEGKVTKQTMVDAEAKRKDSFYTTEPQTNFNSITLGDNANNPTYREKVVEFKRADQVKDENALIPRSSHFPEQEDYVMHTRIYDETIDNTPTRVLTEIQSDMFQAKGDRYLVTDPSTLPFQKTWLRKGIERELVDGINEGRQQLAIPISGKVENLHRSPGVQKWYETSVLNTAKKVAKETNSDFKIADRTETERLSNVLATLSDEGKDEEFSAMFKEHLGVDMTKEKFSAMPAGERREFVDEMKSIQVPIDSSVNYAVITPRSKNFSTTLYTSPVAGAFVAYQAYQAGMSEEAVESKLAKDYEYDEEDIAEVRQRVELIAKAQEAGMSIEDIKEKMEGRETVATTRSSDPTKPKGNLDDTAQAARLNDLTNVTGSRLDGKQSPAAENYNKIVDETVDMSAEELVSSLKVIHPTMVSDTLTTIPAFFGNKEAKQRYDIARESSRKRIVDTAKTSYGLDLVWAPEGVASEGFYANTEEGLVEVTPGFWEDVKKLSGEVAGGVAGAIAGAKAGALLAPPTPWTKAAGTVIGAAIGGIGGAVGGSQVDYLYQAIKLQEDMEAEAMAYKALSAFEAAAIGEAIGYPVIKGLGAGWNGIVKAKNYIQTGEIRSAYKSLKDTTFLNDDQVADIVAQLEKHTTLEGNQYEKGIKAVALTEPGMQDLVRAAAGTNPKAGSATANIVNSRAEDVLLQTSKLTDEQVPKMLAQDLKNYTIDVKDQYAKVKALATQSPKGLNFQWNMDELAIQPVMDDLYKKLVDPVTKEKFMLQMQRINGMSESHKYGDLIELRQTVNDFLYNTKIAKADDKDSIRKVLNNIDSAIEEGAESVLENPKQWLKDWSKARSDYSQMKQVERTAMYRSMYDAKGNLRAVQPETIVKSLGKYLTAVDGSFESIMSKLPIEGRKMYEGAVVDALTKQFTSGVPQGSPAVHFPLLADELRKINLTTPAARATKNALLELGETFKNDVYLAQTSGKISIPQFQSYLTVDPVVRAKFEVASGVFNYVKSKAPGDANRQLALVRATSKLLEKPLDVQNFKFLQEQVFDDSNLSKQILELQQSAARNKAKDVDVGSSKVKIYSGGKLKGTNQVASIPPHRILTLTQAKEIAETESITLDSKSLDAILIKYGYKAILESSDRVRILGDK